MPSQAPDPRERKFLPFFALPLTAVGAFNLAQGDPTRSPGTLSTFVEQARARPEDYFTTSLQVLRAYVDCVVFGDSISRATCPDLLELCKQLDRARGMPLANFLLASVNSKASGFPPMLLSALRSYETSGYDPHCADGIGRTINFSDLSPLKPQSVHTLAEDALARACVSAHASGDQQHAELFGKYAIALRVGRINAIQRQDPGRKEQEALLGRCALVAEEVAPLLHLTRKLERRAQRTSEFRDEAYLQLLHGMLTDLFDLMGEKHPWRQITLLRRCELLSRIEAVTTLEIQMELGMGTVAQATSPTTNLLSTLPMLSASDLAHIITITRTVPREMGGGKCFEGVRLSLRDLAKGYGMRLAPDEEENL